MLPQPRGPSVCNCYVLSSMNSSALDSRSFMRFRMLFETSPSGEICLLNAPKPTSLLSLIPQSSNAQSHPFYTALLSVNPLFLCVSRTTKTRITVRCNYCTGIYKYSTNGIVRNISLTLCVEKVSTNPATMRPPFSCTCLPHSPPPSFLALKNFFVNGSTQALPRLPKPSIGFTCEQTLQLE